MYQGEAGGWTPGIQGKPEEASLGKKGDVKTPEEGNSNKDEYEDEYGEGGNKEQSDDS